MMNTSHATRALEEAVLGVISSLDKPTSPAGTAKQAFYNELFGRDREQRARFRKNVLSVTIEELKSVTEKYLANTEPAMGLITSKAMVNEAESLEMEIRQL